MIDGGTGNDSMVGLAGNDTYVIDSTSDVIVEAAASGTDTAIINLTSGTYTVASNVENITLGGSSNINATGNTGDNVITGNSGDNTMTGLAGNDTYYVDNAGDLVAEALSAGTDLVYSSITYTLAANTENLTLTAGGAVDGTGNTLDNVLTGGSGTNTLTGLAGNDTYIISTGDIVVEGASAGTDSVQTGISYTLTANVENLTLTGSGNVNGTGNTAVNTITGNSGNNVLDGGTGADTMIGAAGDDTYMVDNTSDVVTETASNGTDLVSSSVTFTLSTNVENLTLTGGGAINGTGNASDNVITGTTGANTMTGLAGNDTYIVDHASDLVVEAASAGTDTVRSSIAYTLGTNVENLVLTGVGNIAGTGNAANNVITGNGASNIITGAAGTDTMTGGLGADIFDFNLSTESTVGAGHDVITDFTHTQGDRIDLTGIDADTTVALDQAFSFVGGAAFSGGSNHLHELRYAGGLIQGDTNGDGTADFEIQVTGSPTLVAADFFL